MKSMIFLRYFDAHKAFVTMHHRNEDEMMTPTLQERIKLPEKLKKKMENMSGIWREKSQNVHQNDIKIQTPTLPKFVLGQEIDFENRSLQFLSNFDLGPKNRQHRKPLNLHFRFKIQILLKPKMFDFVLG